MAPLQNKWRSTIVRDRRRHAIADWPAALPDCDVTTRLCSVVELQKYRGARRTVRALHRSSLCPGLCLPRFDCTAKHPTALPGTHPPIKILVLI